MKPYRLKILTPKERVYDGEVISITVPGEDGRLTVLTDHAPMVAMLIEGPIAIRTQQEDLEGTVGQGILQVGHNEAVAMVHAFAWADDELAGEPDADVTVLEEPPLSLNNKI